VGKKKDKEKANEEPVGAGLIPDDAAHDALDAIAPDEHELEARAHPAPPVVVSHRPGRVLPAPPPGAPVTAAAREIVSRIAGSTLCYGEPVRAGERAVIPAARVRARGGMGFGGNPDEGGGGGGGIVNAAPAGFIEVGPEGARYQAVPQRRAATFAAAGAALAAGAAAGIVGAVAARRRPPARTGLRALRRGR
jgi:hypothetical protein